MVELISDRHHTHAIFGNELKGSRNARIELKGAISIKGFKCRVEKCGRGQCVNNAHQLFRANFTLHGRQDDSMSGKRAILEPKQGYKDTLKKDTNHNPIFFIKEVNNYPAICYPDYWETSYVKEAVIERQKIYLKR